MAYVDAMHVTDLVAAAVLVIGAVVALTTLPGQVVRTDDAESRAREGGAEGELVGGSR